MLEIILTSVAKLVEIAAKLAAGKISEAEARTECMTVGARITETDSDTELAEYEELM